jgi:four helix bundle protein
MEPPYDIQDRSFLFGCRIISFCRELSIGDAVTRRLSWQLLNAGTSVGANLEEADAGQTKPDFIAKVSIARKECGEARYWLRLVAFAEPSASPAVAPLLDESGQLVRILTTIIKNAQSNTGRGGPL